MWMIIAAALVAGICEGTLVATAQFAPLTGKSPAETVAINAAQIVQAAQRAASLGAVVLNTPEFALLGNASLSSCVDTKDMLPYSEALPALNMRVNCSIPAAHAIVACGISPTIAVGYNTVEAANGTVYNTQVVLLNRTIVARYRKVHVFFTKCFATPSLDVVTLPLYGKLWGIFTCFDMFFSTPKENLIKAGATHFFYANAIPLVSLDAVELWSRQNNVTVVSADATFGQGAVVTNGVAVAKTPSKGNDVVVANV